MELVQWPLNRNLLRVDNLFEQFFSEPIQTLRAKEKTLPKSWTPKVDIYNTKDSYLIKAELPGMGKEDIKVDVDGTVLTLKGEKTLENSEDKTCRRREIIYGSFERSFTLPDAVDPETIKAEFNNGLLTLEVLKPEEKKPKQITIH